jgi:CheY-like chemotaxis protein
MDKITEWAYKAARHIRNSDEKSPLEWGAEGGDLLAELRSLNPKTYDSLVKNGSGQKEMLIVDDRPENLEAAKAVFPDAVFASSAKEAIELMKKHPEKFDRVITDLEMETPAAGARVLAHAMGTMRECIVLTNAGQNHGSEMVAVLPSELKLSRIYGDNPNSGKAGTEPWEVAKCLMENQPIHPYLCEGEDYYKKYPDRFEKDQEALEERRLGYQHLVSAFRRNRHKYLDKKEIADRETARVGLLIWLSPLPGVGSRWNSENNAIQKELVRIREELFPKKADPKNEGPSGPSM